MNTAPSPVSIPGDPDNSSPFVESLPQEITSGTQSASMTLKQGFSFVASTDEATTKLGIAQGVKIVGYLDDPYVVDSGTQQIMLAKWKIEGETVTLDATEITGPRRLLAASVTYSAVTVPEPGNSFVPLPSGYEYDPKRGTLHDYCSYSPDSWFAADFRGPCAKHDMCYDKANKLSGDAKSRAIRGCNNRLKLDMDNNCESAFGKFDPRRQACYNIATTYWDAVTAKNHCYLHGDTSGIRRSRSGPTRLSRIELTLERQTWPRTS